MGIGMPQKLLGEALRRLEAEGRPYAIATVVRVSGSSLGKPGFKMLISDRGEIVYGTLGGVCLEGPIISVAQEAVRTEEPRLVKVHLESAESSLKGMSQSQGADEIFVETFCGGTMEIFVDPVLPPRKLVLVGQGGKDDVEEALVRIGRTLGFDVWVVDPMPMLETEPDRLITDVDADLSTMGIGPRDCVVVLTKGERDLKVLTELSRTSPAYIGLVASRKRAAHDFDELRRIGLPPSYIESISAPAGIEIGAKTPAEIALSIMAEIVARIRGRRVERRAEQAPTERERSGERVEQTFTGSGLSCEVPTSLGGKPK
jgi:xanthine dehydrogenase accessory factor